MSGLRQTSSVLANLGTLHIVTGRITYSTGTPSLTSNDPTATVADTGTGNATVTFGQAFSAAPQIFVEALKATHSATTHNTVICEQATTTTAEFRWLEHASPGTHMAFLTGSATWTDPASIADGDELTQDITVTGAALGDIALVSQSIDITDLGLTGTVSATNTVTAQMWNNTGGAIDLGTGTVTAVTFTPAAAAVGTANSSPDPADTEAFMFVAIGLRDK